MSFDVTGATPWLGLLIFGGFVLFMIMKRGWKWTQVLSGVMLLAVLYGRFPALPETLNSAVAGIIRAFTG